MYIRKEVTVMHVPTDGWKNGAWNNKLPHFDLLAEMLGSKSPRTLTEVQELIAQVASAKVFAENIATFVTAVGGDEDAAAKRLELVEDRLRLLEPLPFMSLDGMSDPRQFSGVAIWPAGTANWTELRLEQIRMARRAGADFKYVIRLGSSRRCTTLADRAHPALRDAGELYVPTERELQQRLAGSGGYEDLVWRDPELPEINDQGRPLSLQQQLEYLITSGQYEELIGGEDIYVPSNPNALYVPLHVRRILGEENVWFSQAGARLVRKTPDCWWPSLQQVMTTPNGILRLWAELLQAGCIIER